MKRKLKFHVLEITIVDAIEGAELIEQPEQAVLTDEQYEKIKKILSNEQAVPEMESDHEGGRGRSPHP